MYVSVNQLRSICTYLQTYSYARHFMSTCVRVCGYELKSGRIEVDNRMVPVGHCPAGVDVRRVQLDLWVRVPTCVFFCTDKCNARLRPGVQQDTESLYALHTGKGTAAGRDTSDAAKDVLRKAGLFLSRTKSKDRSKIQQNAESQRALRGGKKIVVSHDEPRTLCRRFSFYYLLFDIEKTHLAMCSFDPLANFFKIIQIGLALWSWFK
jgi:hypothetical protein